MSRRARFPASGTTRTIVSVTLMSMPPPRTKTRNFTRLSEIARVMTRHGFGYLLQARRPWDRRAALADPASSQRGQHLREMLDELGPTFVKFGQVLSTRPDLLPPDIIAELRGLQDDVRPFPAEQAEQ